MSKVLSLQQKKNIKAIELMFRDLDDDYLKNALLCAYAGQDESILDELVAQQKEDYEIMIQKMKIDNIQDMLIPQHELDAKNTELLISQQNITDESTRCENDKQQDTTQG